MIKIETISKWPFNYVFEDGQLKGWIYHEFVGEYPITGYGERFTFHAIPYRNVSSELLRIVAVKIDELNGA